MTHRGTPAALLLDLDGTLVDTEPVHRAAYRRFFEGRGWSVPDLSLFTGRRAEDVFAAEPGPWAGEDGHALAREVMALIDAAAMPDPVPGATELLAAAARRRVPVAIVTSAGPAWVRRLAGGTLAALADVQVVVTAEDVTDGKPDPAGYDLACRRLGVAPADALAVEDSPAGVRAAVAAGVGEVVGVTTTHAAAPLTAAGASRVLADLSSLADRLG
ncbi:HAD family hydrolase [Nocardioides sp. T2.26MG-1]|uniref:HAD family hydrolase n=1 Tax=Nocardioides sp. T2.26MG-1 TaxID=3041166 RepID=UPI0024772E51|nr:HAD family phosphatase [Nocardioides sp. T2.26MG-1]CAI9402567.1 Validoxylamine A 7'-phosphate phosphatase [Nocardioides sp. T2.26MG-1]